MRFIYGSLRELNHEREEIENAESIPKIFPLAF